MDEVDFTILAATSVLGDLIEKCPPAEACRDAFDRMSKATVQMCMSTTGFGSSAGALNSRRRSHAPHPHQNHSQNADSNNNDYISAGKQFQRPMRQPTRPVPQFDMSLNDLLGPVSERGSGAGSQRPSSRNSITTSGLKIEYEPSSYSTSATPASRQTTAATNTSMRSPSDYAISPPLSSFDLANSNNPPNTAGTPTSTSNSAIDPALLPSPQGNYAQAVQQSYGSNPYQELQFPFQNAPGMDFLQSGANGWEGVAQGNMGEGGGQNWSGDLGMGMGWDVGDHDFSEGGNGGLDLFDGFFFGGSGTGNF